MTIKVIDEVGRQAALNNFIREIEEYKQQREKFEKEGGK